MKNKQDLQRLNKCINFIRVKVLDYGLSINDMPEEFFKKLQARVTLYGEQMEELPKYIRDLMFKCLKDNNCSIKDETALVAIEIIKKSVEEFIDATDTHPKLVLRMNAKDIFEIVSEFEENKDNIKIAAYALGQYKITASGNKENPKEPPEFEDPDDDLDWIDLEEEEDDENEFINNG